VSKAVKRPSGDSFDPGAEETRVLPGGRNEPDVDDFNETIALPDTREAESGLRGDAEQTVATSDAPTYDLYRDDPNSEETRVISPAGDAGDMERTLVRPRGAGDYQQDDADHDRTETLGSYTRTDPETASYAEQRARRRAEAERRASERADRERALGAVPATEEPDPVIEPLPKRTTDKAFASIGLFLFRLVLAVIMGVHAYQHLTNRGATIDLIEAANLPYGSSLVWVLGIGEVLIAVALLLGWFTRFTGLALAAIGALSLIYVHWGRFNLFYDMGFRGELELLITTCGLLLFCLGSGGWAIDAGRRKVRDRRKALKG